MLAVNSDMNWPNGAKLDIYHAYGPMPSATECELAVHCRDRARSDAIRSRCESSANQIDEFKFETQLGENCEEEQ